MNEKLRELVEANGGQIVVFSKVSDLRSLPLAKILVLQARAVRTILVSWSMTGLPESPSLRWHTLRW
jgi:hypothetical protein